MHGALKITQQQIKLKYSTTQTYRAPFIWMSGAQNKKHTSEWFLCIFPMLIISPFVHSCIHIIKCLWINSCRCEGQHLVHIITVFCVFFVFQNLNCGASPTSLAMKCQLYPLWQGMMHVHGGMSLDRHLLLSRENKVAYNDSSDDGWCWMVV